MVEFPDKTIYVYDKTIDFRKGIGSLTTLIQVSFPDEKLERCLFLFFSRSAKQVKIIEMEKDSVWLYQNRLDHHKFSYPKTDKSIRITASELRFILRTVEPVKKVRKD